MRALLLAGGMLLAGSAAWTETIRVATFNVSLARSGPGLLFKDLSKKPVTEQVANLVEIIARVDPDILLVNELDYDGGNQAAFRFALLLSERGVEYPYGFARPPNTGVPSGHDLDGDGEVGGPGDAFGFGRFPGQYGMVILSRFPIDDGQSRSFAQMRWTEFPSALLPVDETGAPFPSAKAQAVMRLSSKAHWDVLVETPDGPLHVLASHPTPPVFDGPEDMNGRRNHDEIAFWVRYLDGEAFTDDDGKTGPMGPGPFVVLGDLNADPQDGDGRREGIAGLLSHPRITDPQPRSRGGEEAATEQGGANAAQVGDPALDTADWNDDRGPGNLRVDYVLPASELTVRDAGVFWPESGADGHNLLTTKEGQTTDHRLVWVDIELR